MLSNKVHPSDAPAFNRRLMIYIPFYFIASMIGDLSASIVESSCEDLFLNIHTWLFVHSVIPLAFALVLLLRKLCDFLSDPQQSIRWIVVLCLLFSVVWLLVGSILFWGYLLQSTCQQWIHYYMWVRLSIGWLFYVGLLFFLFK